MKNIIGNIGAIFIFAKAIWPDLDGQMIYASVVDGSILTHLLDLGLAYIAFMYGKENVLVLTDRVDRG